MIRELLRQQQGALDHYFRHLVIEPVEAALQILQECRGTLILSGVGKSGYVAKKIAATLLSMGIRAFFLNPMEAVHGDLGFVASSDLFLPFSKSGESQELLDLIPYIRSRGAKTIAIVSNDRSRLARLADFSVTLPVERELCPYDLAPTTSTAVQLLFGDLLAIALMRTKQIPLEEFARNHPGGFIGRRISLKTHDLMLKGEAIPLCRPADRLLDALHELSSKRCGCLLVVGPDKKLLGLFTDGDLRRSLQSKGAAALETSLQDLMSQSPRTIPPDLLALEALRRMEEDPARLITVLPVVEDGVVVGLLRMHDILQAGLS